MALVKTKEMLIKAQMGGYAVGAFNAENMEMVMAIIEAATEQKAPVIIQTTPSTLGYATPSVYAATVRALAESAPVPVAIHLDHGSSFELAEACIESGYTSVMIDGSKLPLKENIKLSKAVVEMASKHSIPVEAELGSVGGKEDDLVAAGGYTDPDQAAEFVKASGIDSLAVAIGTAHGVYAVEPKLDIELLKKIRSKVDIPLVLHGASGLSDESIKACIAEGICKVNFATELRQAYTEGVRGALKDEKAFDPKIYGKAGKNAVKKLVADRMAVCRCTGKEDIQ